MRALYISYDGVLDPLGPSQIIPYIAGLAEKGIKFTLITYEKKEKLDDIEKVLKLKKVFEDKNIKWGVLRYHKSPTVPATTFDIFIGTIKSLFIILRDKMDIIHARSFVGAIPALILVKFFRCKFLFDYRGFYPEERVDGNIWKSNGVLFRTAKWFEKRCLKNADWTVCLTEEARYIIKNLDYMKKKNKRIDVIPTCVDVNKFSVRDKDNDLLEKLEIKGRFIFVYLGSIGTWYMLDEMLDFFKVAKRINQYSFFLFLSSFKKEVNKNISSKLISKNDYHIENVLYLDVPRWLSIADVAISFIKPVYSKKSSCPTKFAEYLACGLPLVINAGIGDTDRYVKQYNLGTVIEEFSESEYSKAAIRIFELVNDNHQIRKNCRLVAERSFSIEKATDQYFQIYNHLIR